MATTTKQVTARERARRAKAKLAEQRAERDRKIVAAIEEFFGAQEKLQAAKDAVQDAEVTTASSIGSLVGLGLTNASIAELCEIDESEVRSLKKLAKEQRASAKQDELELAAADDET